MPTTVILWMSVTTCLTSSEPVLTLLSPNGGENWMGGTLQTITWASAGPISFVKLEYSSNSGASWATIATDVVNAGSYLWTLPNIAAPAALVRISDAADSVPADVSDSVFAIIISSLFLTSPNGGEI